MVLTLREPRVEGNNLSYEITIVEGKLPVANAGPVSLFIDIIGLPFTPLSFAGVDGAPPTAPWSGAAPPQPPTKPRQPRPAPMQPRRTSCKQAAASADQARSAAAAVQKTPQQKLAELQSLYDQKLISATDYEAAKKKVLNELTQ